MAKAIGEFEVDTRRAERFWTETLKKKPANLLEGDELKVYAEFMLTWMGALRSKHEEVNRHRKLAGEARKETYRVIAKCRTQLENVTAWLDDAQSRAQIKHNRSTE